MSAPKMIDETRCEDCDFVARNVQGLRGHRMSTHSEPRKCPYCERVFTSPGPYGSHVKAHIRQNEAAEQPKVIEEAEVVSSEVVIIPKLHLVGEPMQLSSTELLRKINEALPHLAALDQLLAKVGEILPYVGELSRRHGELDATLGLMQELFNSTSRGQ